MKENLKKAIENIAFIMVKKDAMSACFFGMYQPIQPEGVKKLNKFKKKMMLMY